MNVKSSQLAALLLAASVIIGPLSCGFRPSGSRRESSVGHYGGYSEEKYREVRRTSFYLTMRDGVRIATDLYLPTGLKGGDRLPTILVQTRYGRAIELRPPFGALARFV